MTEPQKEYIITEKELNWIHNHEAYHRIKSRPYTSAEQVLDEIVAWKRKHCYWYYVNEHEGEQRYHFEPAKFDEFIKKLREREQK